MPDKPAYFSPDELDLIGARALAMKAAHLDDPGWCVTCHDLARAAAALWDKITPQ